MNFSRRGSPQLDVISGLDSASPSTSSTFIAFILGQAGLMAATMESLIELTRKGDVTVVHVRRTSLMDDLTVQALHSHLTQGIEHGSYRKLVLNLTQLKFISSSALGMLVGVRMVAGEHGGQVRLFGLNKMMQDLIEVSNLTSMLGVHDSEASALASLQAG